MHTMTNPETVTLTQAVMRYGVPLSTLRFWLDKRELTRNFDEKHRVVLNVAELEEKLKHYHSQLDR
jgi:hypothetical protein